jgi:hypothetical protein
MRHVRENPPLLPPDIPPSVRAVVERAMAKDPAQRWPSASAFALVARRTAAELASAVPQPGAAQANAPVTPGQPPRIGGHGPVTPTPTPTSPGPPVPVGGPRVIPPVLHPPGTAPGAVPPGYRQPVPGYVPAPVRQHQRTNNGLIVAIIVAVVLVAICVGAVIAIVQQQSNQASALGTAAAVTAEGAPAVEHRKGD